LLVASAVTPVGSVSETVPLWVVVRPVVDDDRQRERLAHARRLHRSGAAEPQRLRATVCTQLSYSAQLPQRWKRPSTGGTIRTTLSV
jgi:hypothetical protein